MPPPSDVPVDLTAVADPVEAFRDADARSRPVLLRTSGTGTAVVRSTGSWVASFPHVSRLAGLDATSRVWVPGPATASMSLFALVHAAYAGASVVDRAGEADHAVLTPGRLEELLAGAVPPAGLTVVVAGDRLDAGLAERAAAAGLRVHHYYGAAELSFVAWGTHAEDLRPFPGVEVEVRDQEIWVRSGYLCEGYDGEPGPLRRSPDGFATVADRGALADGRLLVHGRAGAVTTGGATVPVAEVERVLREAASGEVVVTGTPHPRLGTVLTAVLTVAGDRERLAAVARARLPAPARPRLWLHVARLPLNPAGKVDRAALARLGGSAGARRLT